MNQLITYIVTPSGVQQTARNLQGSWQALRSELSKIHYIVQTELRVKIYDKTLGLFFLLLEPILMATVYYVLTMVLLGSGTSKATFFNIYVAVVFWRWFNRTIDNAPGLFSGYGSVLKQTNYPVYSIVMSHIALEFTNVCFALVVLVPFLSAFHYLPNYAYLALPIVMLSQFCLMLPIALSLATAGAFVKDLQGVVYAVVGIWFYLSPGIYPVDRIPERYLWIYNLNPFAHILPAYRTIMLRGEFPDLLPLAVIALISLALAVGASRLLARARYHFFSYL